MENQNSNYLVPGAIIVAGALIAGALMYSSQSGLGSAPSLKNAAVGPAVGDSGGGNPAPILENLEDDDPILGNPDAPVVIVEFADFQCPFCKRLYEDAEAKVISKYVKTGKAKWVYRDFPLSSIHAVAQKAAEASECADEQGEFWPYHDMLYDKQSDLSLDNFKAWAQELGLDKNKFNECLDSGKYADEVQNDFKAGQAAGVSGTPATFINGRIITGAVPFERFEQAIEEELKK